MISPFWSTRTFIVVGGAAIVPIWIISEMPGRMRGPSHHVATTAESTWTSCSVNVSETESTIEEQPQSRLQKKTAKARRPLINDLILPICNEHYTLIIERKSRAREFVILGAQGVDKSTSAP